jgi:probable rRNA maturation factor
MIQSYNTDILQNISKDIQIDKLNELCNKHFLLDREINIVFVEQREMKELNKKYRGKDEVTDVLSFNLDNNTILGEIYICPEYVIKDIKREKFDEEIIRLLIHGILHLQGFDHKKKFDEVDYKAEPMYIKQEEILNKFLTQMIRE